MPTADLTSAAAEGYAAPPLAKCPYYPSSPNGLAWFVGRWLLQSCRSAPKSVRAGRGYRIRSHDMLFKVDSSNGSVVQEH